MARVGSFTLVVLFLSVLIGCKKQSSSTPAPVGESKARKDDPAVIQKGLIGTWTVPSFELNGKKLDAVNTMFFTFDDKTLTAKWKPQPGETKHFDSTDRLTVTIDADGFFSRTYSYTLSSAGNDVGIDLSFTNDAKEVIVLKGIVAGEGDFFRLCHGRLPGVPRPTAFVTKEGDEMLLLNLKRHKP